MFEKLSEPGHVGKTGMHRLQKPEAKTTVWTPNAAEGCLFEEDHVGGGAEEFRPRIERPTLILPGRGRYIQAHPQWPAPKGKDRIIPVLLQRTRPATLSLLSKIKGSESGRPSHDPTRRKRWGPLLPTSSTSSPQNLGYYRALIDSRTG